LPGIIGLVRSYRLCLGLVHLLARLRVAIPWALLQELGKDA